ncbi:MAG TPA: hypothetical protein DDY98_07765 [Ruminococcaceae bacterium]|nr:hypothetical protein [Oscillospiraceae bacterium]
MTEFTILLAEIPIRVQALYPQTKAFCADYLTEKTPVFCVTIEPQDIAYEQKFSEKTAEREHKPIVRFLPEYLETLAVYRKIANKMPSYGVLLFHGAAVAVDGQVYLFTAQSGTGKTTHMKYWLEQYGERATVVNGDKPLIKMTDNGVFVCGTPWQGKEKYGKNTVLPLKALCILQRDTHDHIEKVSFSKEFSVILRQTYQPPFADGLEKTLDLLTDLSKKIPLYKLGCTMNPQSALVSYQGMQ